MKDSIDGEIDKLQKRISDLEEHLDCMGDVSRLILSEEEIEQLIKKACVLLAGCRNYNFAWIILIDDEGRYQHASEFGMGEASVVLKKQLSEQKFPDCFEKLINGGLPVQTVLVGTDCPGCPLAGVCPGARSVLVRLEYGGSVLGVLAVNFQPEVFNDEDEVSFIKAAAESLSSGIHRIIRKNGIAGGDVLYKYLFETAVDSIYLLSDDGRFLEVNEHACRSLQYKREELLRLNISKIDLSFPEKDYFLFWEQIPFDQQTLFETIHVCRDGTQMPVEVSGKKFLSNGRVFFFAIARDLTDRKQNEEALYSAMRKAEEADRLKSAFLANMSHEIRTPLNGILGFASLMNDPEITPEVQQEYYDIITKSGQRLLNTINDLIDISRIESGVVEVEMEKVNINRELEELLDFFKPDVEQKGLGFELDSVLSDAGKIIETDGEKLHAVLTNLIKNAVKFTDEGTIAIGCVRTDGYLKFHVRDTGVGIPEDKHREVFDRFIQADLSVTKPYEGSGLGLSISKEYIEMLGGSIWLESEPGKGSEFFFTIPAGRSSDSSGGL